MYLGFVLSQGNLKMDPSKVDAILNWPPPKVETKVRSFNGLAQYYSKFVKHFSAICDPMLDTIKGGMMMRFHWTPQEDDGFEILKKRITTQPIMVLPSFENIFIVECDASIVAIRAALGQEGRPVTFHSEKINDAKRKYSSYDLELYELGQVLRKWRHYLLPKEFMVYSNNQAPIFLNS